MSDIDTKRPEVDEAKREFMTKFGKYAATAPLGMYLLMGPGASRAQASGSAGKIGKCVVKWCSKAGGKSKELTYIVYDENHKVVADADWTKKFGDGYDWKIVEYDNGNVELFNRKGKQVDIAQLNNKQFAALKCVLGQM
ncbi:hypothetical protein [Hydrogenimonas sp.]